MVTKNKNIISFIVSSLFIIILLSFAACKPKPEEKKESLNLNYNNYVLDLYEEVILFAVDDKYNPIEIEITWSSSDDSVATVNEGKVTALKEGTAVISASGNGKTGQCTIIVSNSNSVPSIRLNNIFQDTLNISKDSNFIINAELYYKDELLNAVFIYTVEDDGIISVDDTGKVTGINKGTTYLTIKTSWKGFNPVFTTKTIVVNVK